MLKIRLSRFGKKNQPHYRIIVTERRSKRDGGYVDNLGYYIPYQQPALLKMDTGKYDNWIAQGAQPSQVVNYLRMKAKKNQEVEIPKIAKTIKNKT